MTSFAGQNENWKKTFLWVFVIHLRKNYRNWAFPCISFTSSYVDPLFIRSLSWLASVHSWAVSCFLRFMMKKVAAVSSKSVLHEKMKTQKDRRAFIERKAPKIKIITFFRKWAFAKNITKNAILEPRECLRQDSCAAIASSQAVLLRKFLHYRTSQ